MKRSSSTVNDLEVIGEEIVRHSRKSSPWRVVKDPDPKTDLKNIHITS